MRFKIVLFILLTLFSSLKPTEAQSDPCSLPTTLSSFETATLSGDVEAWEQRYKNSDCPENVKRGVELMASVVNVAAGNMKEPCAQQAIAASFASATLSHDVDLWARIYASHECQEGVAEIIHNLHLASRILGGGTLVFDTLSEDQGWVIPSAKGITARFTNGVMTVQTLAEGGLFPPIIIPGALVDPQNFYIEIDTSFLPTKSDQWIGFAFGDLSNNRFHVFIAGDIWDRWGYWFGERLNETVTRFAEERYDGDLFEYEAPATMALEANNGRYTLYVNGKTVNTRFVQSYGDEVGFIIMNGGCCGSRGGAPIRRVVVGLTKEEVQSAQ